MPPSGLFTSLDEFVGCGYRLSPGASTVNSDPLILYSTTAYAQTQSTHHTPTTSLTHPRRSQSPPPPTHTTRTCSLRAGPNPSICRSVASNVRQAHVRSGAGTTACRRGWRRRTAFGAALTFAAPRTPARCARPNPTLLAMGQSKGQRRQDAE